MESKPTAEELDVYLSGLMAGALLVLCVWIILDALNRRSSSPRPVMVYDVDPSELEGSSDG